VTEAQAVNNLPVVVLQQHLTGTGSGLKSMSIRIKVLCLEVGW